MSKRQRPCVVCRGKARFGRVCDECRDESQGRRPVVEQAAETPVLVSAAPFIEWLERQAVFADGGLTGIARISDVTEDWLRKGAFRRTGTIDLLMAEKVLEAHHVFTWEVYDEGELPKPEPEPEKPTVDKRGRSLAKRRGVPCRLTDEQLVAAYRLHVEGGMSLRELGRRGYKVWGYPSAHAASASLSTGFKRMNLVARPRIEATIQASTVHGLAPRSARAGDPGFSEHRKAVRRKSGEVRGVKCKAVKVQPPGKGRPCQHYALEGSEFCLAHDPARAAERAERLATAREQIAA